MTLEQVINQFLSKTSNYYGYKKSTVSNLFFNKRENAEDKKSFVDRLGGSYYSENVDASVFAAAVKETVTGYSSNKDSAIDIFKRLEKYIEKEMKCKIGTKFPDIPVSNSFERLMFIAKYFHDPSKTVEGLEDELWTRGRTLEDDLNRLRGNIDPIQVCGKQFIISDTEREKGHIYFGSTAHPIFLTCNLTQVVAMLKGLDELSNKPEWKGYTDTLEESIYQQLSNYGKERIKKVLTELIPDDVGIIERLDSTSKKTFYTEYECSNRGTNALLMSLKNEKPVFVEYMAENGPIFYENVKCLEYMEDGFLVEIDGKQYKLNSKLVIRSSVNKEDLF